MIWTALLGLGLVVALAGVFVLWAKLEEQKQKAADEHANYLAALNLHNTTAEALEQREARVKCSAAAVMWYSANNKRLQDRLSAILCPSSNHVWKDGICTKCGRKKD